MVFKGITPPNYQLQTLDSCSRPNSIARGNFMQRARLLSRGGVNAKCPPNITPRGTSLLQNPQTVCKTSNFGPVHAVPSPKRPMIPPTTKKSCSPFPNAPHTPAAASTAGASPSTSPSSTSK